MSKTYHLHRPERDMPDRAAHLEVIRSQRYLTLAACQDNQPYLVSLDYVYEEQANCFYIHTALAGRLQDCIRANPQVWGQIVEDRGYVSGKCTHAYRSVMFEATASLVTDLKLRRRAVEMMIDFYEPPAQAALMKERLGGFGGLEKTNIYRLAVAAMTGKKAP
jgi:uncharacterized protein